MNRKLWLGFASQLDFVKGLTPALFGSLQRLPPLLWYPVLLKASSSLFKTILSNCWCGFLGFVDTMRIKVGCPSSTQKGA